MSRQVRPMCPMTTWSDLIHRCKFLSWLEAGLFLCIPTMCILTKPDLACRITGPERQPERAQGPPREWRACPEPAAPGWQHDCTR